MSFHLILAFGIKKFHMNLDFISTVLLVHSKGDHAWDIVTMNNFLNFLA